MLLKRLAVLQIGKQGPEDACMANQCRLSSGTSFKDFFGVMIQLQDIFLQRTITLVYQPFCFIT